MLQQPFDVVTGGAGFIGSHLCHELLQQGAGVRIIDDFSKGKESNLTQAGLGSSSRVEVVKADITDQARMERLLKGVRFVFHQAALTSVQESVEAPVRVNAVNLGGTLSLLEAARRAKAAKFVFASSTAVYGNLGNLPQSEDLIPQPASPYAAGKLAAELYCGIYTRLHGLPTLCLRYFNVFGERQDAESEYAAVIPRFIGRRLAGQAPVIFGDGRQTRDFVYVGDVVRANLLAARSEVSGVVLNVASGTGISLRQLSKRLDDLMGSGRPPVHEPARPGEVRHSQASTLETSRLIGFEAEVSFSEGLGRTIEWFRKAATGSASD